MSASMIPTASPRAASAAARLTVTEDLPTPPLPEAIIRTRVALGTAVSGGCSAIRLRAVVMAAAFSSWLSSVHRMVTLLMPGSDATLVFTSRWICARNGHPAVVRATVMVATPSSSISTPLAMPRLTMSAPSSGSMTPRRTPKTSSVVGVLTT